MYKYTNIQQCSRQDRERERERERGYLRAQIETEKELVEGKLDTNVEIVYSL